ISLRVFHPELPELAEDVGAARGRGHEERGARGLAGGAAVEDTLLGGEGIGGAALLEEGARGEVLDGGLGADGGGLGLDEADREAGRLGFDVLLAERLDLGRVVGGAGEVGLEGGHLGAVEAEDRLLTLRAVREPEDAERRENYPVPEPVTHRVASS
ncbi:MAG: hypothetical protein ACK56I_35590, partial [bacterium]